MYSLLPLYSCFSAFLYVLPLTAFLVCLVAHCRRDIAYFPSEANTKLLELIEFVMQPLRKRDDEAACDRVEIDHRIVVVVIG